MAGIAGAVDLKGTRSFAPQSLGAMVAALAHRGPDDQHTHEEPGMAMAACRLALVDAARGRQPMANETGTVWVAFNGELFEHQRLLEDLRSRGHRIATQCDTEVWVHLYEEYGEQMFDHAHGQFAVALWDASRRTLLLGCDRFGSCPLHYAQSDGWLLWGSEAKALLASGLVQPRPDPKGINHLFCFYVAGTRRSCFSGISLVPPGHYVKVHDGHVDIRKYWDLDFPDAGDERRVRDESELACELEYLLRQSLRRRLRGDVPVACQLSGGIDSSMVLALGSQENGHPLPAFTVGLDNAGPDESTKAGQAARFVGAPLTRVTLNRAGIAAAYPELIVAAEVPVVDTSSACMVRLAQAVHEQGYKVILAGSGADEALAGHPHHKLQKIQAALGWRVGRLLHWLLDGGLRVPLGDGTTRRTGFREMAGVRTTRQGTYEIFGRCRESLYSHQMWQALEDHAPFDDLNLTNDRVTRWHPINQALYVDYRVFQPGLVLAASGDRSAMNASVETRAPFYDDDVVAFCAAIHPRYKLRGMTEKWLLRRVAAAMLPREIVWRRKHGMRADFSIVFLGESRPPWVDELLSPASLRAAGYFDPDAVAEQRARQLGGRRRVAPRLAYDAALTGVVATQLWHHVFCGGGLADLPTWSPPRAQAAPQAKAVEDRAYLTEAGS